MRYIVMLLLSYPMALVLRHLLHPKRTPVLLRYLFSLCAGMCLCLFCFSQQQVLLLVFIVAISYLILLIIPPAYTQRQGFVKGVERGLSEVSQISPVIRAVCLLGEFLV